MRVERSVICFQVDPASPGVSRTPPPPPRSRSPAPRERGAGRGQRGGAGTEPAHLHVSSDMGDTWEELPALRSVPSVPNWTFPGPPHEAHVKNIAFDAAGANTILASIEVGGLLRSTDGGRSWHELSGFYEDVHRIAQKPGQPDWIYLATGNGVWQTTDGGSSWKQITDRTTRIAYPDGIVIHPETPD